MTGGILLKSCFMDSNTFGHLLHRRIIARLAVMSVEFALRCDRFSALVVSTAAGVLKLNIVLRETLAQIFPKTHRLVLETFPFGKKNDS